MTRKKQIISQAKAYFSLCQEDGQFSEERAGAVLQALEKNPPRNCLPILKAFLVLVRRAVADATAQVEYAGALSDSAQESLRSKLSEAYGRSIDVKTNRNDELIAGLRVRVGCDVYDASVASTLREFQASLA